MFDGVGIEVKNIHIFEFSKFLDLRCKDFSVYFHFFK